MPFGLFYSLCLNHKKMIHRHDKSSGQNGSMSVYFTNLGEKKFKEINAFKVLPPVLDQVMTLGWSLAFMPETLLKVVMI